MIRGLHFSQRHGAQLKAQDVSANNLANVNTPALEGYPHLCCLSRLFCTGSTMAPSDGDKPSRLPSAPWGRGFLEEVVTGLAREPAGNRPGT